MMTISDIDLLCRDELREAIEANLSRRPTDIALDKRVPHASLVATQVKYLQRAADKLPAMYAARCIIPPRAFEQSSSEVCAAHNPISGHSVADLTCGLGVDAAALSRRFERVVAVERDEVLAAVARENFSRLGIGNVEVVCASAEEWVGSCSERFDWIYVDPDRRDADGRKMVCMEHCSPDVLSLRERLALLAPRMAVKCSPLFDCDEAFRLFSPCRVEVVSLGGECKEVDIYTGEEPDMLHAVALGQGECSFPSDAPHAEPCGEPFRADAGWRYLITPDVSLLKARRAVDSLGAEASMWSAGGYAFCRELPQRTLLGRVDEIAEIEEYRPKALRRRYAGVGVEVLKRDCRLSADAIRRAAALRPGADVRIAFTDIGGKTWAIRLK